MKHAHTLIKEAKTSPKQPGCVGLTGTGKGLCEGLAADAAAEIGRLAAAAARDLAGGGHLEAVELTLRAGLTQLGGSLLEGLLAADRGASRPGGRLRGRAPGAVRVLPG